MTEEADNLDQKYFRLHEPITITPKGDIPEITYSYLYIRRPDPYRFHVGDINFYLKESEYKKVKTRLSSGEKFEGARLFERSDLDMIELYDPDVDALAYISTEMMTETVRVKQSDETNL